MAKLVFGCGYLGHRVARRWVQSGDTVFAVTRRAARVAELEREGIRALVGDVTESVDVPGDIAFETVLYALGHDRSAGKSIRDVYVRGLANALRVLPPTVERLIYVSSTGVYAQSDGQWIDEDSPCRPQREGGRACLAAEGILASHRIGSRTVVLRMAGLYGPGRLPKLNALQRGAPLTVASDGLLNLVHIEDAAAAVMAAETRAALPSRYLVADGHPVARREFYVELARRLGLAPPRFDEQSAESMVLGRGSTSKRVRNRRMLSELGVELRYPTYLEGLDSIVSGIR